MNKLYCALLLAFFLAPLPCFAAEGSTTVELRCAAFFPTDKRFRQIYGSVNPSFQIETSTPLNCIVDMWANFDWFSKRAAVSGCGKTRIDIPNLSLGLKKVCPLTCCFDVYVGLGASFSWITLKNPACGGGFEKTTKFAFGGVLKTGVNYTLCKCIFLDFFVDYLYLPVHINRTIDCGGLKAGVGIGYQF